MGCRGTIEIWEHGAAPKDEARPVVLYTHWGANEMEDDLRNVLSRRERWNDFSYLSRMIFSRMIRNNINGETGYGIMTDNAGDAEKEIVVDCSRQEVIIKKRTGNKTYTFDDFISLLGSETDRDILSDDDIKQLKVLGRNIYTSLECDINSSGVPCLTDRLYAVELMKEYLSIHRSDK